MTLSSIQVPHFEEMGIGSSPFRYFAAAALITIVAKVVLAASAPLAVIFFAASAWSLCSGAIIAATRYFDFKVIHYLHAGTMEFNSILVAGLLLPLSFLPSYHQPSGAPNGNPILLLNGYASFGATWEFMRRFLVEEKLGPIYIMEIGTGESIELYADQVAVKIKQIQKDTNNKPLTIVGHSKGGLVALATAEKLAKQVNQAVAGLITIGSPLKGTHVANLGIGNDAAEMRPESPFIQKLQRTLNELHQIKLLHIVSEADLIVPFQSAQREENMISFSNLGHLSLVYSSRVASVICQFVKSL